MTHANERQQIIQTIDSFSSLMKLKMLKKLGQGYHDWRDPNAIPDIDRRLSENREKCDWVDVANCAMILFELEAKR